MNRSHGTAMCCGRAMARSHAPAACEPLERRQLLAADLLTSSIGAQQQTVTPSENVQLRMTFRNAGDDDAGAFRIQAFLSEDNIIGNGDDIPLGAFRRGVGLDAGQSATVNRSFPIPDDIEPGDYFIGYRLDSGSGIPEDNEDNNARLSASRVITIEDGDLGAEYEIVGRGDEVIEDDDTTPNTGDGTQFAAARVDGVTRTRTFTIVNTSDEDLEIEDIVITGAHADDFEVVDQPEDVIAAGDSGTFTIRFDPSAAGARRATVTVTPGSGDDDDGYSFSISGRGTRPAGVPNIQITGADIITDGDTSPSADEGTHFGRVSVSSFSEQTFTIANTGTGTLNLTSPFITISGRNPSRFTIIEDPDDTSLAPGESTTFRVRFNPGSPGDKRGVIQIFSNDPQESTFDFAIRGNGRPR